MSNQNELNKQNNAVPTDTDAEAIKSELTESELDSISGGPTAVEKVMVFTKPLELANPQVTNNTIKQ
jgi:bacteriocin-like protein